MSENSYLMTHRVVLSRSHFRGMPQYPSMVPVLWRFARFEQNWHKERNNDILYGVTFYEFVVYIGSLRTQRRRDSLRVSTELQELSTNSSMCLVLYNGNRYIYYELFLREHVTKSIKKLLVSCLFTQVSNQNATGSLVRCVSREKFSKEGNLWCRETDVIDETSSMLVLENRPLSSTKGKVPLQIQPQKVKLRLRRGKYHLTIFIKLSWQFSWQLSW